MKLVRRGSRLRGKGRERERETEREKERERETDGSIDSSRQSFWDIFEAIFVGKDYQLVLP